MKAFELEEVILTISIHLRLLKVPSDRFLPFSANETKTRYGQTNERPDGIDRLLGVREGIYILYICVLLGLISSQSEAPKIMLPSIQHPTFDSVKKINRLCYKL